MDILTAERRPVRPPLPRAAWAESLRLAVRDAAELCRVLALPPSVEQAAGEAQRQFPLLVTREYLARIRPGDPRDPLLRQVLPLDEELRPVPGFSHDPVGDGAAELQPGVLQKYHGRALLVTTGACAVHCRYCFRRHFPYEDAPKGTAAWSEALGAIDADPDLREVILSGGDPLTLVDSTLAALARRIAAIDHIRRLRIHTRLPIFIPSRVNDEFLAWLTGTRLAPWVVVHVNHPREIDEAVAAALGRLVAAGVPVLNQAVLLRGVNDDVPTLAELCETLVDLRVTPYYLHQLDRVRGAAHFEVEPGRGRQLIAALRARLPGYAVPRYVQEIAGEAHKMPLV